MAEDVSDSGHWGNGDYRIIIRDTTDMEYSLSLIKQSFDQNSKNDSTFTSGKFTEEQHLERCDNTIKDTYNRLKD